MELELRPVHERTAASTRGHLLVVILAYLLRKELGHRWPPLDQTVAAGLERLNTYRAVAVVGVIQVLLQPRANVQELLTAARVTVQPPLPGAPAQAATKSWLCSWDGS